jgi:signal transduction histidine kinase
MSKEDARGLNQVSTEPSWPARVEAGSALAHSLVARSENRLEACAVGDPDRSDRVGAIIHSLSQPLTCLRGVLELSLLGEGGPEVYRAAIEEALVQADRLFRLLESCREPAAGAVQAEMRRPVAPSAPNIEPVSKREEVSKGPDRAHGL